MRSLRELGSVALGLLALAPLTACSGDPGVVISELMAANASGKTDADGDTSDWIELHNRGKTAVDLEGWCLTDDPLDRARWCFPTVSMAPQAYLVVFASGKPTTQTDSELHASFKLKATSDYLALIRPGGKIASELAPYPDQEKDVSFGLIGTGEAGFLSRPTPGAANSEARP